MCCGNLGISSIMFSDIMYGGGCCSGGWGMGFGIGMFPNSCFGWGFGDGCCDPYGFKHMAVGAGIGLGYAGGEFLAAGTCKLVDWVSGLFHKKSNDAASA